MNAERDDKRTLTGAAAITGMLEGLTEILDRLQQVWGQGGEARGTGEVGRDAQGVFGFAVKVGLGKDANLEVKPGGNIRPDAKTGETRVHETYEPVVDVFEESDHTLVVAEMPGIGAADLHLDIRDDLLEIRAESDTRRYRKEILLPRSYRPEQLESKCNNGVLEIRCHNREHSAV
ncbi:Hsp20/alpha crystallin family protein [Candidatus Thiosymbion oneisti]|uniref:Hsp20/alpha crystallin family protein n=1 Tax=Candidatus Thiosymbion oneisti TaxID=589554 RepID=UPI00106089E2|nr:Hsp20/alpha crystallin family protein [Candidatus Thiosymbion oneisti]